MKGRHHLATHTLIFFAALFLIIVSGKATTLFPFLFGLYLGETLFVIGFGIALYFLGAILPDADSSDRGSRVFYTWFFPLAWIVRLLEYPLSLALKREVKHRGSLHTVAGILVSSLVVVLVTSSLYYWLISDTFFVAVPLFWFFCLFIGQCLHLLEDRHFQLV